VPQQRVQEQHHAGPRRENYQVEHDGVAVVARPDVVAEGRAPRDDARERKYERVADVLDAPPHLLERLGRHEERPRAERDHEPGHDRR